MTAGMSPVILSVPSVIQSAPPVILSAAKNLPPQSIEPEMLHSAQHDKKERSP